LLDVFNLLGDILILHTHEIKTFIHSNHKIMMYVSRVCAQYVNDFSKFAEYNEQNLTKLGFSSTHRKLIIKITLKYA